MLEQFVFTEHYFYILPRPHICGLVFYEEEENLMNKLKSFSSNNVSESLYKGLSLSQHKLNNDWFELAYKVTHDDGFLTLSKIGVVLQKTPTGWIKHA
ncbi:MAG: hypothetical protein PHO76_07735 [Methylotenera sp.]|nr:hypothetical protein [Methylotenera sp.]